ncbi:MAG: stage II sporulation protein M [Ignavibacteriota bacterium]|nr:MAG: stage II sporulation protein M [Chlorobiota bacterium]MBE7477902.1 stage II sporulation protein M [Ignavibacteriales bacterium]MBL1123568.1 stage II sporulation protein M [Ignavibacteriota bacterium]MCE7857006.1 stage II sporulation protein M [Ignavibacteria bacterium CHB3]MEB2296699.1 stage II sporulation protein M [Ignavibacteria bacterium]NUM60805.1 stage II sporulation protein M [Ignavibacteriaceae bacterium]
MREVTFLKKNADKWKEFETFLSSKENINPDKLAALFIELTDDLSYSRTFFPESKTTQYLNSLTARVHQSIYKSKKERKERFFRFWKYEAPLLFYKHRLKIVISFSIFFISMLMGVVSSAGDSGFVRLIMGDGYVNMTLENIDKGDPMAIYKQMNGVDMFLGITFNNIRVSFIAFVYGILISFGTGWVLMSNGIMLGAFQYFFHIHNLLFESILVIWIHGTLEISAIIIAGAAGLVLGNSILFPGTYSRRQSFIIGSKEGLKIIVSLVPIFITAGFLESFVTRFTGMPIYLSLTIIISSAIFVIWYFVIYPYRIFHNLISKNAAK